MADKRSVIRHLDHHLPVCAISPKMVEDAWLFSPCESGNTSISGVYADRRALDLSPTGAIPHLQLNMELQFAAIRWLHSILNSNNLIINLCDKCFMTKTTAVISAYIRFEYIRRISSQ